MMRPIHMLTALGLAVLAILAAPRAPAAAAPGASAGAVALAVDGEVTRFELSLDRELEFRVFALTDPYRVIIDLPEIEFRIPAEAGKTGKGLVSAFRFGLFSPGRSRVVIDAAGPVAIAEPVIHKASADRPARLVVEFSPTSHERFVRDFAVNAEAQHTAAVAPPTLRETVVPERLGTNPKPVIVIDPGHGGVDPGTVGRSGVREKDIVLEFAKDLADTLRATGSFKVVLTRTSDLFLRLDRRRAIAHENQADLFISVHADSIRMSGIRGATIYTVSDKASDEEAAALAAKENRADIIAGVQLEDVSEEVSDILIELARRDTRSRSVDFAKVLVTEMKSKVELNSNPHRSASFVVLKSTDVPSVLVELGYLSNQHDEDALLSTRWRARASTSILGALRRFFAPRLAVNQ
jgi:N-acetylmuramoyl-L-alanine amidase